MATRREEIGNRLRKAEKALEMTAKSLCKEIGVNPTTWSNYKAGTRDFPPEAAEQLEEKFDVPANWVYWGKRAQLTGAMRERLDNPDLMTRKRGRPKKMAASRPQKTA